MDINALFTEAGMREATSAWRDTHVTDAQQYGQVAHIIRSRLRQERIVGDRGAVSAKVRAWRVGRHAKKLAKLAQLQAATCEALYGSYVNQVVHLPDRRQAEAQLRDERRRQRAINAGAAVAKSLQKTTAALNGEQASSQVNEPQQQKAFVGAEPFMFPQAAGDEPGMQDLGSIGDFFTAREAGR